MRRMRAQILFRRSYLEGDWFDGLVFIWTGPPADAMDSM